MVHRSPISPNRSELLICEISEKFSSERENDLDDTKDFISINRKRRESQQ